jgi:hypothetical protein
MITIIIFYRNFNNIKMYTNNKLRYNADILKKWFVNVKSIYFLFLYILQYLLYFHFIMKQLINGYLLNILFYLCKLNNYILIKLFIAIRSPV